MDRNWYRVLDDCCVLMMRASSSAEALRRADDEEALGYSPYLRPPTAMRDLRVCAATGCWERFSGLAYRIYCSRTCCNRMQSRAHRARMTGAAPLTERRRVVALGVVRGRAA